MKTAPFGRDRRIGVAWAGPRREGLDANGMDWGGVMIFREIRQRPDGSLATAFVPEMIPATGPRTHPGLEALTPGVELTDGGIRLDAGDGEAVCALRGLPRDVRIQATMRILQPAYRLGLGLRGTGRYESKYDLALRPSERRVELADQSLFPVPLETGLHTVEIIQKGDILDACIDGSQCLVNRLPELKGDSLFLFCEGGAVAFEDLAIAPLA
jgi:hypothetical protein